MPRSLRVVRIAVTVMAAVFAAVLAGGVLELLPPDVGYTVGGKAVSRGEWLRLAAPIFATSAAWFGAAAVGLWTRKPWARFPIIAAFGTVCGFALAGLALGTFPRDLALRAVIQAAVMGALSDVYLYHTPVARYFDALRHPR
ncbi:MAG TPA: hypothetical protein VFJ82_14210 [Longimicrobium sp.]|nr:hypothetical protein [Longimicrobium sp.]